MNQFCVENECEIFTHSQQQPQIGVNRQVDYQNHNALGPPKGYSFTGLRTQLKLSTMHTHSNQQAGLK